MHAAFYAISANFFAIQWPSNRLWTGKAALLCDAVESRLVVEAAIDAAKIAPFDEALELLVDGVAPSNVEQITWRPDSTHRSIIYAIKDLQFQSGCQAVHVRNM